jgi:hypothetical protein
VADGGAQPAARTGSRLNPRPLNERLQERFEELDSHPDQLAPTSRRRVPSPDTDSGAHALDPHIHDLNSQLEVLRQQLEQAFDEVEARVAAAEARADAADTRAQVASARAASVLAAVDDLAAELGRVATVSEDPQLGALRAAVDRMKTRLQSA